MIEQKSVKRLLLALLGFLAAASALFFALYRWDNKYTQPASQPIGGVLMLSTQDILQNPTRFLIREWEYYPGVLLTPDDFSDSAGQHYRQFVSIGQYGGLEAGNPIRSSHTSGTYRLTLRLPEIGRLWALGLPEIFSSCRLYINDSQVLSLGETDPEHYKASIQRKVVSFDSSGQVQLLLQVTDQSGFFSGLTYPPIFGELDAVEQVWNIRLFLHSLLAVFILVSSGLSLYLGTKLHFRNGRLFSLLCLCVAGYTSYLLLDSLFAINIFPWFTLEVLFGTGTLFLSIILMNDLCAVGETTRLYSQGISLSYCIVATAAHALSGVLPTAALQAVSGLSVVMRFGGAAYLLAVAGLSLWRGAQRATLLLGGALFYAISLFWDRIFPLYEPIYGGWFPEIGGLLMCCAIGCFLWNDMVEAYQFRLTFSEQRRYMERQLALQDEHYEELNRQVEVARTASHDLRHHMRTLQELVDAQNYGGVKEYLEQYEPHLAREEVRTLSSHYAADATLRHYQHIAEKSGIKLDIGLFLARDLDFPNDELCILLGNLLENAVEACQKQTGGDRRITLRGGARNGQLGLVVENSFSGEVSRHGDRFFSTKHEGYGLGTQSIHTIVERHGGLLDYEIDSGVFKVSILIPLKEKCDIL